MFEGIEANVFAPSTCGLIQRKWVRSLWLGNTVLTHQDDPTCMFSECGFMAKQFVFRTQVQKRWNWVKSLKEARSCCLKDLSPILTLRI